MQDNILDEIFAAWDNGEIVELFQLIGYITDLTDYSNAIHRVVAMYIQDLMTKPINEVMNVALELADIIERGLPGAWLRGARENGVTEIDEDAQEIINGIIASERDYIPDFVEYVASVAFGAETIGEAMREVEGRLLLWVNRYSDVTGQAITYTADEKTKLIWVYGDTEHCGTCLSLNRIVAYAREWDEAGLHPQGPPNPNLECGGWKCQCQLVPTDEKKTRNALDKLLAIAGR